MATPPKFAAGDKLRALGRRLVATGQALRPGTARRAPPTRQPSHWLRNTLALAVLAGAGVLVWQWNDLRERTVIGSAYAARIGCVCHFVSQRGIKACEADLAIAPLPGVAGMVTLDADDKRRTITAGLPLLGEQKAHYDPAYGCRLDPWED
ncbi:hypothetical protein MTR62_13140 [Novosphingobium sp. 1949]|uniref:Uncharacterized protein n=1 Tax=Novosphingobium organovorum TaxID=2930092 RepID=A0ABT0BFT1_9SPHN|nr:hypothetical protein [Novosphingobium organovorum]MCJ2183629.1 hypothetical protein [Novosphingobium organovorum]